MFTGIIEAFGKVENLKKDGDNLHITLSSSLAKSLKIDQSVAHNGVCLTVVACNAAQYTVTAISETLKKTNLGTLAVGERVNLERAMKLGDRLDGHLVQGHVDQTATCTEVLSEEGSWKYHFTYDPKKGNITIEKGSITVNGVSLTVVDSGSDSFSVAIIPYTYEHTTFHAFKKGTIVNLEFDLIGKYLAKLASKG
ncbi:MAG: riboflavin synthase [Bacteroidetes bacterium]|jgi:riboflavin synthase|nr:riboflavin synthase [Bacteroidota bacterium]MDA0922464.1 riboflavin synthase [Bacteroidota bacterium]MDA1288557.1 riboflavin synthase [Bacteroidota bacterium]